MSKTKTSKKRPAKKSKATKREHALMRFLCAVWVDDEKQVFGFPTAESRDSFFDDLAAKGFRVAKATVPKPKRAR